jgi:hypothetical protein
MKKIAILVALALMLFSIPVSSQPRLDTYFVTIGPGGEFLGGGGSGYDGGMWYLYPSGWINEWFYDHPFAPRPSGKIIHIEFDWMSLTPGIPTFIQVAINWSTPAWSQLGYGPNLPPIPAFPEDLYILRHTALDMSGYFPIMQHFSYDFIIYPYNPEWVSIDVRGYNFIVRNGTMLHDCTIGTKESSWGSIKADFK